MDHVYAVRTASREPPIDEVDIWQSKERSLDSLGSLRSSRYGEPSANPRHFLTFTCYLLALVEYHCTKSMDVASRIFEKGLQTFGEETEYVLRYLGFLISVNDENS